MQKLLLSILMSQFLACSSVATHPLALAQAEQQLANAAYLEANYVAFTEHMQNALQHNPDSFATRYNLACGLALTGQADRALDLLEEVALAGIDFDMQNDSDLVSLRSNPRFESITSILRERVQRISNSTELVRIAELGLAPEGIARDSGSGRLFFGSMRSGEVFVLDSNLNHSRFASLAPFGPYSAIGMEVDEARGLLWVIGTWFQLAEGYAAEDVHASGLFAFDLTSGAYVRHYHVDESVAGLNDVNVAANGDVYVSGARVHVLKNGSDRLVPLQTTPELFSANGITSNATGSTLFVSTYAVGVGVIDLASGQLRYLAAPEDQPLYGIDGLYWHEGDLLAVQNGVLPWKLLRIAFDTREARVTEVQVIEARSTDLTPTTGAIDGNRIHYIGQGPDPEQLPSHFPEVLRGSAGATIIMSAPVRL